jgi:hypothetical protein
MVFRAQTLLDDAVVAQNGERVRVGEVDHAVQRFASQAADQDFAKDAHAVAILPSGTGGTVIILL